jgi:hypothetical protein
VGIGVARSRGRDERLSGFDDIGGEFDRSRVTTL